MIYTKRFLFAFVILLLTVTALLAQDVTPVTTEEPPQQPQAQATQIPVIGNTPVNAQPVAPTAAFMATLGALPTAQPAPGVTPIGGNPPEGTPATAAPNAPTTLELPPVAGDVCPILVQDSYTATALNCPSLISGEACLGNGVVSGEARSDAANFDFSLPGDKTSFTALRELRLQTLDTESKAWTVVVAQVPLNSSDANAPQQNTALVLVGDVVIADDGQATGAGARAATVLATSGINVRRSPNTTGVVVWQLSPGENVTVTGRTADNQWNRIEIPSRFGGIGWVYAPYLDVEGGAETLSFVTVNSDRPDLAPAEFGPMQAINLLSGTTAPNCVDTPNSGILLQSPSGLPVEQSVKMQINDVEVLVNGSVFIQAQSGGTLTVSVLEGSASVTSGGTTETASTGTSLSVTLSNQLEPQGSPARGTVDMAEMAALPVSLLPRTFALVASDTPPVTDNTSTTDTTAPTADTTINTAPVEPTAAPECILTAVEIIRNIRFTPSINADVVGLLQPGETIQAFGAQRDADGLSYIWYETQEGFIRFDTVEANDGCSALTGVPARNVDSGVPAAAATATAGVAGEVPSVATTPLAFSLFSTDFQELCAIEPITSSFTFPDGTSAVNVGGQWTASAGTSARFGVGGGIVFRGEFGDYIRLVDGAGTLIASSGESLSLEHTFAEQTSFQFQVIASKGDFVIITAGCNPG